MKLLELHLAAYGPFTNRTLDLSAGDEGLHVVYGPNEAGKSSALRALRALFFGIDVRTTDNFLHDNARLRIGGRLRLPDGQELDLLRRKGNKDTLLDPATQEPLDESILAPVLGGITRELFEKLFGLNHQMLVEGGEEILRQQGSLGETLFAAGLGTAPLRQVLAQLDAEAGELFLPTGRRPAINRALEQYRATTRELREQSLSVRDYEAERRALAEIQQELGRAESALETERRELNRLQRLDRVKLLLPERAAVAQQRAELGEVPALAEDFGARLAEARELSRQVIARDNAQARLATLQTELDGLRVTQALLEQASAIEDLRDRLGTYRQATADRPGLLARQERAMAEALAALREVWPERTLAEGAPRISPLQRKRVQDLARTHGALEERERLAAAELARVQAQHAAEQAELEALPAPQDSRALAQAVAGALRLGDADAALRVRQEEHAALLERARTALRALPRWQGELEALPALSVPAEQSIEAHDARLREAAAQEHRLREQLEEAQAQQRGAARDLDALARGGDVPDEARLREARNAREAGWQLLRRQWLAGEDVQAEARAYDPARALPEAYEARVRDADGIADQRTSAAERVARQATLLAAQNAAREREQALLAELEAHQETQAARQADWVALWAPLGIEPGSPQEMRAWRTQQQQVAAQVQQVHELARQAEQVRQQRAAVAAPLHAALAPLLPEGARAEAAPVDPSGPADPADTAPLAPLLEQAQGVLAALQARQQAQQQATHGVRELAQRLAQTRHTAEAAQAELQRWQQDWDAATAPLDTPEALRPDSATLVLETLDRMAEAQTRGAEVAGRIAEIDGYVQRFEADVRAVTQILAPELAGQPLEQAVGRLAGALAEQQRLEAKRKALAEQRAQAEAEAQAAVQHLQQADLLYQQLCAEARCEQPTELEARVTLEQTARRLDADLRRVEQQLLQAGEGVERAVLEQELAALDTDSLPGAIAARREAVQRLEQQARTLHGRQGEQEQKLRGMDGGDQAAALAEQGQQILADIRGAAERYLRLRLAARLLRERMEVYRRENQGPILARAGDFFRQLTLGAFAGLEVDYDANDQPVLAGRRAVARDANGDTAEEADDAAAAQASLALEAAPGALVHVSGMSSGTADQLYLALRLAALQHRLDGAGAFPFIVDDVLVNFDDARAAATLRVLAELSRHLQVILFTHHARIAEEARALKGLAFVHPL